MNEQDFVKMIDGRIDAMMQYPRMFGSAGELELTTHILLGMRAEILGKGGETFRNMRPLFCQEKKIRSKFSFHDQFPEDQKFMETIKDYIVFCCRLMDDSAK